MVIRRRGCFNIDIDKQVDNKPKRTNCFGNLCWLGVASKGGGPSFCLGGHGFYKMIYNALLLGGDGGEILDVEVYGHMASNR